MSPVFADNCIYEDAFGNLSGCIAITKGIGIAIWVQEITQIS